MSYAPDYPVTAAQAGAAARAEFIRKTYAHLAGAILAFVALEAALLTLPIGEQIIRTMLSGSWVLILVGFIGVSWLAQAWANSNTSRGMQYLGLSLYVVAEAIIFLPILYIAEKHYDGVIQSAGIMTLAVFGGLTAAVFFSGRDYSHMGTILTIGSFAALGLIVASLLLGFQLGIFFSFAMVALASGSIIYQTSNVIHRYHTDQYVAASLALFASVALLFWYILRIAMASRD